MAVGGLDLSGHWAYIHNTQTVSLFSRTGEGTYGSAVTVDNALKRSTQRAVVDAGTGRLAIAQVTFHLWCAKLDGTTPKFGDVIQEAGGTRWTIIAVADETLGTRYKCSCVKER
jgi:hypothetical protein